MDEGALLRVKNFRRPGAHKGASAVKVGIGAKHAVERVRQLAHDGDYGLQGHLAAGPLVLKYGFDLQFVAHRAARPQ